MRQKAENKPEYYSNIIVRTIKPYLSAVYLFGSLARGEYIPGHSDINLLLILNDSSVTPLKKASVLQRKFGENVNLLCLTREYILTSLDTFPIELLDMKAHHIRLYGEDILPGLQISKEHLRLQCERELKAKISLLWQGLVGCGGDDKGLYEILAGHFSSLAALIQGIVYLYVENIPMRRTELYKLAESKLGLRAELMSDLEKIGKVSGMLKRKGIENLYLELMQVMEKLSREVDIMQASGDA